MLSVLKKATAGAIQEIQDELRVRKTKHFILLFSMGSQFDHLIVQQLAKLGIFCVVADPASVTAADVKKIAPAGLILSGGPAFVGVDPPQFDKAIFDLGIPTLGICLGFQMWAYHIGAKVTAQAKREFGVHTFERVGDDPLFENVPKESIVLESHGDAIEQGSYIEVLGKTDNAPIAAGLFRHLRGVQFHPEVTDTVEGAKMYENFCVRICGITDRFPAHNVAQEKINELRELLSDKSAQGRPASGRKVLIALSGGSDSSVVAYLLKGALEPRGDASRLKGVYIRGIDRPDDEAYVRKYFGSQDWLEVQVV